MLFKGLLNFKRDAWARLRDQRKAKRYAVGQGFPLKASIALIGRDKPDPKVTTTMGWGGRVNNVSDGGISIQLPPAAVTFRGEESVVKLMLEEHKLEIPCVVAHYRSTSTHATCGLQLKFNDPAVENGFHQLIESVISGATLAPARPPSKVKNPTGLISEQYRADNDVTLTAWRDKKTGKLESFELVVDDVCIRGQGVSPFYETYSRNGAASASASAKTARSAPGFSLVMTPDPEVRQLFRWIAANLPATLPSDLRSFVAKAR